MHFSSNPHYKTWMSNSVTKGGQISSQEAILVNIYKKTKQKKPNKQLLIESQMTVYKLFMI